MQKFVYVVTKNFEDDDDNIPVKVFVDEDLAQTFCDYKNNVDAGFDYGYYETEMNWRTP